MFCWSLIRHEDLISFLLGAGNVFWKISWGTYMPCNRDHPFRNVTKGMVVSAPEKKLSIEIREIDRVHVDDTQISKSHQRLE